MIRATILLALLLAGPVQADAGPVSGPVPAVNCADPSTISVHCGRTPTLAAHSGRLWVAFVAGRHVYLSSSGDEGRTYSQPRRVNEVPEDIYTNGENRPKIAFTGSGTLLLSWTRKTSGRFAGEIRFARSDDYRTFSTPITVNDDGLVTSHRFDALAVTPSGKIYVAWLDKRDLVAARSRGGDYNGAALYYAVSNDGGRSFEKNRKVADSSCECCRLATLPRGADQIAIFWRHIFDTNTRDHAIAILSPDGATSARRVSFDNWEIDACPHHGPHMDVDAQQRYHLVWFTNAADRSGIFYRRYDMATPGLEQVVPIATENGAGHPQVVADKRRVYLLWKTFDGQSTSLQIRISSDDGRTFSQAYPGPSTEDASDHPLVVKTGETWLVSWWSRTEGLRVFRLADFTGIETSS